MAISQESDILPNHQVSISREPENPQFMWLKPRDVSDSVLSPTVPQQDVAK